MHIICAYSADTERAGAEHAGGEQDRNANVAKEQQLVNSYVRSVDYYIIAVFLQV